MQNSIPPIVTTGQDLAAAGAALNEATLLLQQFVGLSDRFTRLLGATLDVNSTDLRAMEHLLRSGPLPPSELARRLGVSPAAMTTVVDRLARAGHAHRERDPDDRRRVRVVPAPASADASAAVVMPMVHGLDAELDRFSPSQQQAITAYLAGVVDTMRGHAEGRRPDPV